MFSSYSTTPDSSSEEVPAKSSPPWVWFGFVFAAAFLVAEFVSLFTGMSDEGERVLFLFIAFSGALYWLFCVHRFHKILGEMSRNHYSIKPSEAVWKHFIPFLNLIWIFQWPTEFSDYINARGRVRMVSGKVIGLLLLISSLLRFVDGAVGLSCVFGVTLYLSAKLRRHMKLAKGMELPPIPDASMFRQKEEASSTFGNATP